MPKTTRSLLALSVLPVLAAMLPGQASAQYGQGYLGHPVTIFERPPSVDELRNIVDPDRPVRTRGIEIVGGEIGAGRRSPMADPASLAPAPAVPQAPVAYAPQPSVAYAPQPPVEAAPPAPAPEPVQTAAVAPEQPPAAQSGSFGFRINFAFDSTEIPAESYPFIDAVGSLMRQEPQLALVVEGHTDAVGSDAYNQVLSERRAHAVEQYLLERHGVEPERLRILGQGESRPLAADPFDGINRRVEFARIQ